MKISAQSLDAPTGADDVNRLADALAADLGADPDFVVIQATEPLASPAYTRMLEAAFPRAALIGATSCRGVMTHQGLSGFGAGALAIWGLSDPAGAYGAACRPLTDDEDPADSAVAALEAALAQADRDGELPDAVWLQATPGDEDRIVAALSRHLGDGAPILGGSAADEEIAGRWRVFSRGCGGESCVGVAVLFPSTPVSTTFQSGFAPTDLSGVVTAAEGRRILEIDGRPAAEVFDAWTGGLISGVRRLGGGGVLAETALAPIGVEVGRMRGRAADAALGAPYYRLIHPERVTAEDGLATFAEVAVGERVRLMCGSQSSLIARAGIVAEDAMDWGGLSADQVAGALGVYCAGCMLSLESGDAAERPARKRPIEQARVGLADALGGAPFLTAFTFGEQGCFLGGENRHGNLMVSQLIFSA